MACTLMLLAERLQQFDGRVHARWCILMVVGLLPIQSTRAAWEVERNHIGLSEALARPRAAGLHPGKGSRTSAALLY